MQTIRLPFKIAKRLDDKDRQLLNKLRTVKVSNANIFDTPINIIIGGVIFNMAIDNKIVFRKEFKRLEIQYIHVHGEYEFNEE